MQEVNIDGERGRDVATLRLAYAVKIYRQEYDVAAENTPDLDLMLRRPAMVRLRSIVGCYTFTGITFSARCPFGPCGSSDRSVDLVGEWLSLVEHLVRDQGVGGSNPLSPTNSFKHLKRNSGFPSTPL
jgi:hypothetical protein